MSKIHELAFNAEEIDELLDSVDKKTIYQDATQSKHGLMSTTDKTKLDALPTAQQIDGALNAKVDKEAGKGLSKNDYTDAEKAKVASALQSETDPTVPSWAKQPNKPSYNYSEIGDTPDLSGFITKSVNDLTNYYLKSETYSQTEVNALIGAIQQFHYEIYVTLPQTGQGNVLYLIGPTGSGADKYEEYVYANNAFTKIGDTSIDLSGYVTTSALNTALAGYTLTSELAEVATSGSYNDLTNTPSIPDISGKADKVQNATNGNFAELDANGNITDSGSKSTDFATAAQGALADTAYQKPSSGIPESDLSSDVQQALQKHFKGWYDSSSNLPANPVIGDYAYVKGAESTAPAAIYECTTNGTWSDSERTADTSNVQTFQTGEEVNETPIDKTHLVNPADGALPTAADTMQLAAKLQGVTMEETKYDAVYSGDSQNTYSGYIDSSNGQYHSSTNNYFIVIPVDGIKRVRFLGGIVKTSATYNIGYSFGNITSGTKPDSTLSNYVPILSQEFEKEGDENIQKEYVVQVPDNVAWMAITVWKTIIGESFYCYMQSGESVVEMIPEIIDNLVDGGVNKTLSAEQGVVLNEKTFLLTGGESISNEGDGINGNDNIDGWTIVDGAISSGAWNFNSGARRSCVINLDSWRDAGFNRVIIYKNEDRNSYYTLTTKLFPNSSLDISQMYAYLSSAMLGYTENARITINQDNNPTIINLDEILDSKFIYFIDRFGANQDTLYRPFKVVFQNVSYTASQIIEKSICNEPKLYHCDLTSHGMMVENSKIVTTARVYNDFFCELNEGYVFHRVIRVDNSGNIVDYNVVVPNNTYGTLPKGVIDSADVKKFYGSFWNQPYYGYIMQIKKIDGSDISKEDRIFAKFYHLDDKLKSELKTLPMYNGEQYNDSISNDRTYEKDSIKSVLKRAKIGSMIDWSPLRKVMPTNESWNAYKFLPNKSYTGIPYSRADVRQKWFGIDVSPYTFLTALKNPYSVIYTEHIGNNSSDAWNNNNDTLYPFKSEYGITSYGSGNGVTYYGLVCSAYASYVYGYMSAVQTSMFASDSRNYVLGSYGNASGANQTPVQANTLTPLSTITTPGHTYVVIDFLDDQDGNRIAAIVAEETTPTIKCGFYTIERLQQRFNYEYNNYLQSGNTFAIRVTTPKPSTLYANKDKNIWNVSDLYNIGNILGQMHPNINVDNNVMFYMGDKSVVMKYDTSNYVVNDRCWLIVKPEDIYTDVIVEKWDKSNNAWVSVGNPINIDSNKVNYSDSNTSYYKIDVTELCNGHGKYRACLSGIDNSSNNVYTGYTQWIVLDASIIYNSGTNKITWEVDNTGYENGDDEYCEVVSACYATTNGQPNNDHLAEANAANGYVLRNTSVEASYQRFKIIAHCSWGSTQRTISVNKF